mgnify:CR=1 FL=1
MLNSIRIFIKVVEQGSFSKAGRVLNMAPSSVTRKIDGLENQLGIVLFKRSTRQLLLTAEGEVFLEGANKLIIQANELTTSIKSKNHEPNGLLSLSVFESFGRIHISPLIAEFLQQHPKVSIEIELENRIVDLSKEDVDLAIRIGRPADSSLKARKLLSNHTLICASPEYLDKHSIPVTPEDLMQHNCLALHTNRQKVFWYFKQAKYSKKIAVTGNLSSKGGTPLLDAALKGTGIIQIPNWMVADYIQRGKLIVCLSDWDCSVHENTRGEVYIVYRNSSYIKPVIRAFIDFVVEKLTPANSP